MLLAFGKDDGVVDGGKLLMKTEALVAWQMEFYCEIDVNWVKKKSADDKKNQDKLRQQLLEEMSFQEQRKTFKKCFLSICCKTDT